MIKRLYYGSVGPILFDDEGFIADPSDMFVNMNRVGLATDSYVLAAGFGYLDTDGSHFLTIRWNEDGGANRILSFVLGDGDRTLTVNEDFTIGDGYAGILTYSAASKTLTVESDAIVSQDYSTDSTSVTLAGLALTGNLTLAANSITGTSVDISNAELQLLSTITTAGGALIDDANAAAQIVTLGISATAAELNILDGVTGVTAAELSYIGDVTGLIQAQLDLKATIAGPTFTGTVTVPSTNFTIGSTTFSETQLTDLTDGGDTTAHDHDGISENTTARHVAITLNASATTGGMSLSTQEISNRAATNAQTGYATAAHITAIEANTSKATCNFTNVQTALGVANEAVDFNSQALTGVGAIGCGTITTTDDFILGDADFVGIGAALERLEFYTVGYAVFMGCNVGIGTVTPAQLVEVHKNQNASTLFDIVNPRVGTASVAGHRIISDHSSLDLYALSSGYTTSNQYVADSVVVESSAITSGGLSLSTNMAAPIKFWINGVEKMRVQADGNVKIASLAGTGNRAVIADANGVLSAP